jgi:UDP-N-acetylmuramyl-tripeptide synthetase
VTSHSLQQMRVKGIGFDVAVFTNLSIDHLDFHSTMEEYFLAKSALFRAYADDSRAQGKDPVAVVNVGDEYGRKLLQLIGQAPVPMRTITFSLDGAGEINATRVAWSESGISGSAGGVEFTSRLAGRFNVENILAAIAVAKALGIAPAAIAAGIAALTRVPGRLDPVDDLSRGVPGHGLAVFVDHAHKPGALQVVLQTLREVKKSGRLIVVFGCGGDRDKSKRPIMGRIAQDLADEVWVTSDNSRTEEPSSIIADIMAGISAGISAGTSPPSSVHVEVDRRRAISDAIRGARRGDVVIIAGRGHETYQICYDPSSPTGTRTIDFDDRAEALLALQQFHAG